jgi:hypothetical protein
MIKPSPQKNIQRKGTALFDYVMSALVFALVVGVSIMQINPNVITSFFQYALGFSERDGAQIQLRVLGE